MILPLLRECGAWCLLLVPMLLWAMTLTLHRLQSALRQRLLRQRWEGVLARVDRLLQWATERLDRTGDPAERKLLLQCLLQQTQELSPALARAAIVDEPQFVRGSLPALAPPDEGARAVVVQLETVACLSPAVGLAGTVAGFARLFTAIAQDGLSSGLEGLAVPARSAMTTTLLGILPMAIALLALGLIRVDVDSTALRDALLRWHASMRKLVRDLQDATEPAGACRYGNASCGLDATAGVSLATAVESLPAAMPAASEGAASEP